MDDDIVQTNIKILDFCNLYLETEESAETKKIIVIDVMGREWYAAEPTEEEISIMGQILDKLNDMLDASKKYKSFTGISDGIDGEVKFIHQK